MVHGAAVGRKFEKGPMHVSNCDEIQSSCHVVGHDHARILGRRARNLQPLPVATENLIPVTGCGGCGSRNRDVRFGGSSIPDSPPVAQSLRAARGGDPGDRAYGLDYKRRIRAMGIRDHPTALARHGRTDMRGDSSDRFGGNVSITRSCSGRHTCAVF